MLFETITLLKPSPDNCSSDSILIMPRLIPAFPVKKSATSLKEDRCNITQPGPRMVVAYQYNPVHVNHSLEDFISAQTLELKPPKHDVIARIHL
jgi:hypothetical protein